MQLDYYFCGKHVVLIAPQPRPSEGAWNAEWPLQSTIRVHDGAPEAHLHTHALLGHSPELEKLQGGL